MARPQAEPHAPVAPLLSPERRTLRTPTKLTKLTAREVEILPLVAQGLTDAQVAEKLIISPRTVNWHLSVIYSKLDVSSRSAATRFAMEHTIAGAIHRPNQHRKPSHKKMLL